MFSKVELFIYREFSHPDISRIINIFHIFTYINCLILQTVT